jgi:hypothetical protein
MAADKPISKAPRKPVGRPPKGRGAAMSSDAADARWTVRGVPLNVRAMATKAADRQGLTVGDWLAEAVIAYSRGKVASAGDGVSADGGTNVPAMPLPSELPALLSDIQDRLKAIEADKQRSVLDRLLGRRK